MSVSAEKVQQQQDLLTVYLPDTRGVTISRYGKGNLKLGPDVYSYSKLAELTCPGSTPECRSICYAKRIEGPLLEIYEINTNALVVPPPPKGAKWLRLHVSGDFDSVGYICQWIHIVNINPDIQFWAYTRSWRVPNLLQHLELLRTQKNIQLFASMDESVIGEPPEGWRKAWIKGDSRIKKGLVCPEERGKVDNCQTCGYCFKSIPGDVIFVKH